MFLVVWDILSLEQDQSDIVKKFWWFLSSCWYKHVLNLKNLNIDFDKINYIVSRWAHFKYNEEFLRKFKNLKTIFLFQIWNDNVDLNYCKQNQIEVVNFISSKSVYSVAEQTVASLIFWLRQCFLNNYLLKQIQKGVWERFVGQNLDENITVWIMWFGRIWQTVAKILQSFPTNILAYDIFINSPDFKILDELKNSQKIKFTDDLNYFLENSDYILVHIPGIWENIGLLNYEKLKKVKWVVNMARPKIVVENDVIKLLDEGQMDFYIADVVENEPYLEKINKKLLHHPKVFIIPHIWAHTIWVQQDIIKQFLSYWKNKDLNLT